VFPFCIKGELKHARVGACALPSPAVEVQQGTTQGGRKPVSAYAPIQLPDRTDNTLRTAQAATQTVINATLMEVQRSVQMLQQPQGSRAVERQ
jgi:hypothetical protein